VPQNFLCPQRDQPLLMPVDTREWLPEDDLVFVVLDAVATLDLGGFRCRYRADGHGRAAFDPEMMVALLLYGYCQSERPGRVIEKRCVRDVAYRVIASRLRTDHATIARFRARPRAPLTWAGTAPQRRRSPPLSRTAKATTLPDAGYSCAQPESAVVTAMKDPLVDKATSQPVPSHTLGSPLRHASMPSAAGNVATGGSSACAARCLVEVPTGSF
jgi:hypothetical protein